MLGEIDADHHASRDEDKRVEPTLPVTQRAGRRELQRREDRQRHRGLPPAAPLEFIGIDHYAILSGDQATVLTYRGRVLDFIRCSPLKAWTPASG
jgi:hypothetical protein